MSANNSSSFLWSLLPASKTGVNHRHLLWDLSFLFRLLPAVVTCARFSARSFHEEQKGCGALLCSAAAAPFSHKGAGFKTSARAAASANLSAGDPPRADDREQQPMRTDKEFVDTVQSGLSSQGGEVFLRLIHV